MLTSLIRCQAYDEAPSPHARVDFHKSFPNFASCTDSCDNGIPDCQQKGEGHPVSVCLCSLILSAPATHISPQDAELVAEIIWAARIQEELRWLEHSAPAAHIWSTLPSRPLLGHCLCTTWSIPECQSEQDFHGTEGGPQEVTRRGSNFEHLQAAPPSQDWHHRLDSHMS